MGLWGCSSNGECVGSSLVDSFSPQAVNQTIETFSASQSHNPVRFHSIPTTVRASNLELCTPVSAHAPLLVRADRAELLPQSPRASVHLMLEVWSFDPLSLMMIWPGVVVNKRPLQPWWR